MIQLKTNLINEINNSGLSIEAIMFVIKDVYRDMIEVYQQYEQVQNQQNNQEEK